MSKKHILKEQLGRIQSIMGISEGLLIEAPVPVTKFFVKELLKNASETGDEVIMLLSRMFNLTDNQIDNVVNQINRVGVDNLSDDVLELLARSSIDNVDDFVRFLKAGKFLGSNFDEIASIFFKKIEQYNEITPETRKGYIDLYRRKLDNLDFLDGSTEIKEKLVRDFQSELDSKFADRMARKSANSIDNIVDEMLNTNILDDIPVGAISDKTRDIVARSTESYKNFIRNAKKKGSIVQEMTKEEYDKIIQDYFTGKRIDPEVKAELNTILKKEPSWWSKKPMWAKVIFVIGAFGIGPTVAATLFYATIARFSNWGDISWIRKLFSGSIGTTIELNNSNVENWFESTYPAKYVDKNNFENNFTITLNNTKTKAVIMSNDGTEEWEVLLSDNEIQEIN